MRLAGHPDNTTWYVISLVRQAPDDWTHQCSVFLASHHTKPQHGGDGGWWGTQTVLHYTWYLFWGRSLMNEPGYSRHDKLTRNTVYTVQTNVISPSETASAVTQLSRSGTRCPLRGSRCGCSSISHAVAMQFRQQATEEPLPQQHHSRCPSETAPAVTQSPGSPPHGTHAPHYSIPASVTHSGQR